MRTANFAQNLLSVQTELRHFAYKLTADREDANDAAGNLAKGIG